MGEIIVYIDPDRPLATSSRIWLDGVDVSRFVNRLAIVSDCSDGLTTVELRLIGKVRLIHDVTEAPS